MNAIIACALLGAAASSAAADVLNVPDDYPTIQAAINAADDADEVVVAPGTYAEVISFNGKQITLRSSAGPDATTIDGAGLGDTIVRAIGGETFDTVIEGFSLVNGEGGANQTCVNGQLTAGAVYVGPFSDLTIVDCVFENNGHDLGMAAGGAVAAFNGGIHIVGSTFIDNGGYSADEDDNTAFGGAVYICSRDYEGHLIVENCLFESNGPTSHGGAIWAETSGDVTITDSDFFANGSSWGAGVNAVAHNNELGTLSAVRIQGCTFQDNVAGFGGGIFGQTLYDIGIPGPEALFEVYDCDFIGNLADSTCCNTGIYFSFCWQDGLNFGTYFGGGADIRANRGTVRVVNSLFADNEAVDAAGLHVSTCGEPDFDNYGGTVEVTNCTIADNDGEGLRLRLGHTGDIHVSNTIVRANAADEILSELKEPVEGEALLEVTYSNVEGGYDGDGNIDMPANFVGAGDYRLGAGSPSIDAGDSSALPDDVTDDLAGDPRFVDDPDTIDTGVGPAPVVDMGAYEFQAGCPADYNGDGALNILDFVAYQQGWLAHEPAADCTGDKTFNILDFVCFQQLFVAGCP